ncbi:hypothetical protein VOLCADRAFT_81071 [Volvox carteri f. nagariensis]|uniref:Uncharacterized protein n=1 Tax=Volvox carteri f. nagariensis TaxID=3068 RepID=D8TV74_VOLCA|nr:uncharacterized protein VOLCADRAFT_81071 [Volvox carteri f. nagariensis]EFJ48654.1 hypothetical protein VOLCADRAFT_81071 [Volvox carteri f. nagariensis]|eukprot:XP_002950453.1 hypothetical protein VOLCADRAFT_81071 [Volvox carteri f. nagariensis]
MSNSDKRAEIYTYVAQDPVYAMNWSVRRDRRFRLAVGSFREDVTNYVEIISLDDDAAELRSDPSLRFHHDYPATKLMWLPDREGCRPDLLATTGEALRIWRVLDPDSVAGDGEDLRALLNNNKQSEFSAPLTSFDWNEADPKRLGTSSIDTTCTIWDIEKGEVDTQLIAHDREVYDIAWGGLGVFATVSADGSVRVFDLRDKEHSTIIYESPQPDTPLLRLGWNRQDPRYMATILMDSPKVVILDIRYPTLPVAELHRHQAPVNALAWAPHSAQHICTAGDDSQALIWDVSAVGSGGGQPGALGGGTAGDVSLDPILAYGAQSEVNQLQWSSAQPDWVAICFANKTQILRV